METQTCTGCGEKKLLSEYFNNKIKKNGKDAKCKLCRSTRTKKWIEDNKEIYSEKRHSHYLLNQQKILDEKKLYYKEHQSEILKNKTEYWRKNKSRIQSYRKDYREERRYDMSIQSKVGRKDVIDGVLDFLGPVCVGCGEDNRSFLTVDHINNDGNRERSLGSIGWKRKILNGKSDSSNYQVLCFNCNLGKYRLNPVSHLNRRSSKSTRFCPLCSINKPITFYSDKNKECLDCRRFRRIITTVQCFEKFGGACKCCGVSEPHKLCIDHINNDGSFYRKNFDEKLGSGLYLDLLRNPEVNFDKYQLLCFNCNISKYNNKGVCPHNLNFGPIKRSNKFFPKKARLCDLVDFNLESVDIVSSSLSTSRKFLDEHHYAKYGRSSKKTYSAVIDGKIIAIAKFCFPIRVGVATSLGYEYKDVFELDRFCIHPKYQKKNFASWFMSRIIKRVKEDFRNTKALVSFADPKFGHSGVIYKASNWKEVGKTSHSYVYIDSDGKEINKKTLYNYAKRRNMKERECMELMGLKRQSTPPKIKYIYSM